MKWIGQPLFDEGKNLCCFIIYYFAFFKIKVTDEIST